MSERPAEDWDAKRRALAWIHLALQGLVVVGLLVVINLIARKFPARIDLTSQRRYEVSAIAEDLLRDLPYDVEIWINADTYSAAGDKALPAAILRTSELLEEFKKRSPRLKYYFLSDQGTPRKDVFERTWTIVTPATLFVRAELGPGRTNQQAIEIQKLYESNPATGELTAFRGEPVLVQAIRDLGGATKRIVYETEGHQELPTADGNRLGLLRNFMTLNEGVEFRRLPLVEINRVPEDAHVVMILGPAQFFGEEEVNVLREYLERGGSLLVALRPKVRTGLERFLEDYAVKVGDNIVCDRRSSRSQRITDLWVQEFNVHDVNRGMANTQYLLPDSCTVDPVDKKDPRWTVTPLAMSSPASWEEKGGVGAGDRPQPDADERVGNLKLIVAVEKAVDKPLVPGRRARLIVWGSVAPFTNGVLGPPPMFNQLQIQYVVNHFRWLDERPMMDIKPQQISVKPLDLSAESLSRLRWVVLGGFPALGIALGILAWFVRRK